MTSDEFNQIKRLKLCKILLSEHPLWPVRLGVRTSAFHAGNTGSIPVQVTMTLWLNRLEYRTVDPVVAGSSPVKVADQLYKELSYD